MVSFLTDTVVCGFSLYHILAYFLIYSCIGWCLEVIYAAATTGQLVNRGFLNGPVCPIYGFGMIIVLFALTPLQHSILLLYIGGVILPSALELVGGWALYKIYHTRWWDYSDFPFNIGGYICLEFCLLWGVGTLVVMRIVHPVVADLVALIPPFVGVILMCFLYAVYAVDVVVRSLGVNYTAIAASALADTLDTMEQLGDSIHAVSDAMTQLLGTTALTADQKLDEGRLQFKLAAAEARDAAGKRPSARETMAAIRTKAAEASEAARRASEDARLNAVEAANAARLAAKGTAERAAELLQLEQLAAELQQRSEEMQAQLSPRMRSCCARPASWAPAVCCVPTRNSGTAKNCAACPYCGRCCTAPGRTTPRRTTTRKPNDSQCRTGTAVCGIFVALCSNNVVRKCEKPISKRLKPCYTDYKVYQLTVIDLSVLNLSKL